MSNREFLAREAMVEPEPIIDRLVEYLLTLKAKAKESLKSTETSLNYDALLLSYPTLAKDWLSPEEEEAWKDYQ
jgi:hypothetical protein